MNRVLRSVLYQTSKCLQRDPLRRKGRGAFVGRGIPRGGEEPVCCTHVQVLSTSEEATAVLAAYFARQKCMPGDCYLLYGDVGAGKSFFSREFIRFALEDEEMEVPSPTYLLHNEYGTGGMPMIHHYDLYRILDEPNGSLERLDFENMVQSGVCLVEWPQRLAALGMVPEERVELSFRLNASSAIDDTYQDLHEERIIDIRGFGPEWKHVVDRLSEHIVQRGDVLGLQCLSV